MSTVFSCPFCGGGDTCSVKLDREHKLGTITCSACQAKYTKEITPLDEAIDVYSEWIDMCAAPRAARCASPCINRVHRVWLPRNSCRRRLRRALPPCTPPCAATDARSHARRSEEVNTAEGRGRAVDPRSAEEREEDEDLEDERRDNEGRYHD